MSLGDGWRLYIYLWDENDGYKLFARHRRFTNVNNDNNNMWSISGPDAGVAFYIFIFWYLPSRRRIAFAFHLYCDDETVDVCVCALSPDRFHIGVQFHIQQNMVGVWFFRVEQEPHVVLAVRYYRWPTLCARTEVFNVAMTLEMVLIYKQMDVCVCVMLDTGHGPDTCRATMRKHLTYRKWARMKQIAGLLDFVDEHIDQHGISVIQVPTQVGGDIR